jgi:hypothetical protein
MKRSINLFVAITILSAFALSSCYKEGPKISFRTKANRLANQWSLVDYQVNGSTDETLKKAWKSGDTMELLFVITKGDSYGFNIQYTKGSGKIFTANKPEQGSVYASIQNTFRDNVIFSQRLARGGKWTFIDKFKKIRFGVIGNPDVAFDENTDILEADLLMLKNDKMKMSFDQGGQTHTMTFEAWEQ